MNGRGNRHMELSITSGQRFETGILATLARNDVLTTRHIVGHNRDAMRALAELCDAEGWKIVCVSTPATIFRDLHGSRNIGKRQHGDTMREVFPEARLLKDIGRLDLIAETA